ncbi:MAG: hypothetical protein HZC25_08965 [Rhodospirillales bacterium]|nr:hypothetical protein [Rhodospirillales bacterium]
MASVAQTARSAEVEITFESRAEAGLVPANFSSALTGQGRPPAWRLGKDRDDAGETPTVAETSGDETDYRFPLLIYQPLEARDGEVTVVFKPVAGRVDRAAGIAFRLRDERNYYVVRANALEGNVRLYRVVNGQRHQFAGRDVAVASGRWQELTVRATGNRFEVLLNGAALFQATDTTFSGGGRVALWTKSDSLTHFRKLTIRTDR